MTLAKSYNEWRKLVFLRDACCVLCNATERLEADHVQPRSVAPELRLEVDNGRVLCHSCHVKTDSYGGKQRRGKKADRNPYGPG